MWATNSASALDRSSMNVLMVMPLLRAALHLAQRLADRPARRRVVELDLAVLEMGGRLAVGDDDDLLVGGRVTSKDPAGEEQAVLQVRAVLVAVQAQLGKRARRDLAGVVGEPDDREMVARVLRPDQGVECDRHLLRREKAAAQQHGPAHVDQQHRRGLRQRFGPDRPRSRRAEPDGRAGPVGPPGRSRRDPAR